MNKNMYKKGKNANKTVRYKKKRNNNHKNTQKKMVKIGGEEMNKGMNKVMKGGAVCDDLSTINQSNLLDIFKYNIQVPKLVIPHIFEIVIDELATGVPGSSPDASSSGSSSKSSGKSSGKSKSSSSKNVNFSDAKKQPFEQQLMYDSIDKDGNCFFAAIASQINEISRQNIFPGFELTKEINQQDVRNAIGTYYKLADNYKVLQDQSNAKALFFGNVENMSDNPVDADTYITGIEGKQWGAEKEMSAIEDGALNALTNNSQLSIYIYGIRDGRLYNTKFASVLLNPEIRKDSIPIIFFYNDKGGGSGGNHYDRLYFDAADANKTLKLYQDFIKNAKPSEAKIVEPSE